MKNEKQQIEIGPNLAIFLGVSVSVLVLSATQLGGCAINGHYKAKAVEAMNPDTHRVFENPPAWKIVEKE